MADSNITKQALANALKELLEQQPLEKISVNAICQRCGMNRKSFYYHFRDKFELVEWIYDSEFIAVMQGELDPLGWHFVERLCKYFDENRSFYAKTLAYEGQNSFSDYFYDFVTALLRHDLRKLQLPSFASDEAEDFAVTFFADALTCAIKRWIMGGSHIPPDRFVRMLQMCIYGVPQASPHRAELGDAAKLDKD